MFPESICNLLAALIRHECFHYLIVIPRPLEVGVCNLLVRNLFEAMNAVLALRRCAEYLVELVQNVIGELVHRRRCDEFLNGLRRLTSRLRDH